jgi:hypothetical protein
MRQMALWIPSQSKALNERIAGLRRGAPPVRIVREAPGERHSSEHFIGNYVLRYYRECYNAESAPYRFDGGHSAPPVLTR